MSCSLIVNAVLHKRRSEMFKQNAVTMFLMKDEKGSLEILGNEPIL